MLERPPPDQRQARHRRLKFATAGMIHLVAVRLVEPREAVLLAQRVERGGDLARGVGDVTDRELHEAGRERVRSLKIEAELQHRVDKPCDAPHVPLCHGGADDNLAARKADRGHPGPRALSRGRCHGEVLRGRPMDAKTKVGVQNLFLFEFF